MATNLYIETANQKGINSPSDRNPLVPPDISPPGTYNFNLYYLDWVLPPSADTYHRYATASMEINLRKLGPAETGTFTISFLGYTSAPIDINANNGELLDAFVAIRSVGAGNAILTGNAITGWIFEFVGDRGGLAQALISADVTGCSPASTAVINQTQAGGNGQNCKQRLRIRQTRVASVSSFTEIGVGTTPGWTTASALSTAGLTSAFWTSPAYDIVLEVKLFLAGGRSGTDGITVTDARARSGTDGVITGSPGSSRTVKLITAYRYYVYFHSGTVNSPPFTQDDVGRTITGQFIPAGTVITEIRYPYAIISQQHTIATDGIDTAVTGVRLTNNYSAATANFAAADLGHPITGTNIPAGTTIATVVDAQNVTLSQTPTAAGTGLSWAIANLVSTTYQSATATFTSGDVGQSLSGTNIPAGTTIVSVTDGSHCVLSNRPTAAGTVLAWQIINTIPGSSGAPVVTRLQTGNASQPEIQRIVFAEVPDYGSFTVSLGGIATAAIPVAINPADIQAALNTAYPNLASFAVANPAKSIVDITFGINGAQALFTVDDTAIGYDNVVASIILVPGAGVITPPTPDPTIVYDGDFDTANPAGALRITNLSDGTGAIVARQRYMQRRSRWTRRALNSAGPIGTYLIGEDGMEDLGGGIVAWDRVYASLPAARTERHQQMRPCIGTARTYSGSTVIDIQLYSLSISTWVNVNYTYTLGKPSGNPPDGPAGTVIHFVNGAQVLLPFNGFDSFQGTFNRQFTQSWSRRRWMGDIWEQAQFVN